MQGFLQTGEWPKKRGKTKEETLRKVEDPYGEFPYDLKPLTKGGVESAAGLANHMAKMKEAGGVFVPDHFKWDDKRKKAALGDFGPVARRAARNDILWGRYLALTERGIEVTADLLKQAVELEEAIREVQSAESEEEEAYLFDELTRRFI